MMYALHVQVAFMDVF